MLNLSVVRNTAQITRRLQEVLDRTADLRPLLLEIGEDLTESAKQRFSTLTDPDGFGWQENSELVIARKGHDIPLTGKTHMLRNTIDYQLRGDTRVEIGSPLAYSVVQQFGGWSYWEEYGEWWKVPPRPFIGLSQQDAQTILHLTGDYLVPNPV